MKKQKTINFIGIFAILIGCSLLLYPILSNYLDSKNGSYAITSYDSTVEELKQQEVDSIFQAAREYNSRLIGHSLVGDPFSTSYTEEDLEYDALLNPDGNGMMGYIRIPKIGVELPMYHGTEESILQKAIGHFKGSSLPVGGESTHCVLTGHRGLPDTDLFSDLDQLEIDDIFYLKVMNETMAYQVDQILTVLPDETEALDVVEGMDYVTLVTCTPYAVNTHRLLVRGHRIPYKEAVEKVDDEVKKKVWIPKEVMIALIIIVVLVVIRMLVWLRRKKK